MYATSKLIIPPKPARNSPYIPKLRIKLRPTQSRVRGVRSHQQEAVFDKPNLRASRRRILFDHRDDSLDSNHNGNTSNGVEGSFTAFDSQPTGNALSPAAKSGLKRKRTLDSAEDVDLDGPDSILTKINLKTLINRDTFYALPIDTQRALADLLPLYDRQKQPLVVYSDILPPLDDTSDSADSPQAVWLHPSALSNEFFSKALHDYTERQARGDFSQRVRNRTGLRASAVGRQRYASQLWADNSLSQSAAKTSTPIVPAKSKRVDRTSRTKISRMALLASQTTSRIRNRKQQQQQMTFMTNGSGRIGTRRSCTSSSGRNLRHPSARLMNQTDHNESNASVDVSSERTVKTDDSSVRLNEPSNGLVLNEFDSSHQPLTPLVVRKRDVSPAPTAQSKRASTVESPKRIRQIQTLNSSSPKPNESTTPSESKHPLNSPRPTGTEAQVPHSMPPPRQTKTLAAMREKMRAKRMMKEAERQRPMGSFYGLSGSMTPHPASGSCGYFHQPPGYVLPNNLGSFPSPDIGKGSSSAFSSPRGHSSASPSSCDRPTSAAVSSHSHMDTGFSKTVSFSPSSPHSLPVSNTFSPNPNSGIDFLTRIFNESNDTFAQSYPSSPCSGKSNKESLQSNVASAPPAVAAGPSSHPTDQINSAPSTPVDFNLGTCIQGSLPSLDVIGSTTKPPIPTGPLHTSVQRCVSTGSQPSVIHSASDPTTPLRPSPTNSDAKSSTTASPILPQLSIPINSGRSNTRAFFVDRDNLPQALALLQSLNPTATITQQQFLLIPGANKSQLFLCRAPTTTTASSDDHTTTTTSSSNGMTSVSQSQQTSTTQLVSSCTTDVTSAVVHNTTSFTSAPCIRPVQALNGPSLPTQASTLNIDGSAAIKPVECVKPTPPNVSFVESVQNRHTTECLLSKQTPITPKPIASTPRIVFQQPNHHQVYNTPTTTRPAQLTISLLPSSVESPIVLFSEPPSNHLTQTVVQQSALPLDLIPTDMTIDPVYLQPANSTAKRHVIIPQQQRTMLTTPANPVLSCIQPSNMCVIPSPGTPGNSQQSSTNQLMTTTLHQTPASLIRYQEQRLVSPTYPHFVTSSSITPVVSMLSPPLHTIQSKQTCFVLHPDHITTTNVPRPPFC